MAKDTKQLIQEQRERFYEEHTRSLEEAAAECESPIETLLLWALVNGPRTSGHSGYRDADYYPCWDLPGTDERGGCWWITLGDHLVVMTQVPVAHEGRAYRIDFVVSLEERWGPSGAPHVAKVQVAVECDGHDFHERTKQQASRDKQKDRDLQALGYRVLRFSGSDIYRDADAVAAEILRFTYDELVKAAHAIDEAARRAKAAHESGEAE